MAGRKSVCLLVCPQLNSKKKDPKVFKLGAGNDLGISYVVWFWKSKVKVTVYKRIFHTVVRGITRNE